MTCTLYQGIGRPWWSRKRPLSSGFNRSMTCSNPPTASAASSGAPAPPMSVRTQPGWNATTHVLFADMPRASSTLAMFSAALLIA